MSELRPMDSGADGAQPWEEMVLPYVLGELSPEQRGRFESILKESALCRVRVYETQRLVRQLRSAPKERLSRDLSAEILARIAWESDSAKKSHRVPAFPWRSLLKAAACVAILASGVLFAEKTLFVRNRIANAVSRVAPVESKQAVAKGLDWLAAVQEPSGFWDGSKWGGNRQYTVGLTGLALLAFARGEEEPLNGPHAKRIRQAVDYLTRAQNHKGRIGENIPGTRYDHAIATCALLEIYSHRPDADLRRVLDRAIHYILANPDSYSALSYRIAGSAWSLLALKRAADLGWTEPLNAGNTINLASLQSEDTGKMLRGAVDFYRYYLLSIELASSGREEVHSVLATLQERIIAEQEQEGPLAGSWDLSDGFSAAGGRVYTTSLATLTLCANPAGKRT